MDERRLRALPTLLAFVAAACGGARHDELPKTPPTPPVHDAGSAAVTPETNAEREGEGVVDETSGDVAASDTAANDAATLDAGAEPEPQHAFQTPLPPRELARDAPAQRAANLTPSACLAELKKRKLPVERDRGAASGVAAPVRITGPLGGVRFVAPGKKSVYGKLDCRLALVLDELATVLERHGVVSVRVDNLYRPKAHLPGKRTSSQHRYGLAADITAFERADGSVLSVETEWHGEIGTDPCGPDARLVEPTPTAIALRDLVCDIARSGSFHHLLTPSYNAAHRDHVHFDIKRGEKRFIIE